MQEPQQQFSSAQISEKQKASLEKAFATFQRQCDFLEKSHIELQKKLDQAQLSLEEKNRELAQRIQEIESIKEKLSGILSSITDAVILTDPSGIIHMTNKAADNLLQKLLESPANLKDIPEIAQFMTTETLIRDVEIELTRNDETTCMILCVAPMSASSDKGTFRVISLKNVTEYRNLQDRLKREDRLAALGKVAASVAHEIRNPLGAIEGFARLLERDLAEQPSLQRLASKTVYGARQLNSVVSNLLNYTREIKPYAEKCDVNHLVREALEFTRPIAEDRKIEVSEELGPDPLITEINSLQFKQVLTNLILNAIDACTTVNDGHIIIKAKLTGRHIVIEVIDNGNGVSADNKKRIFEPFFTMKEGGVGLGLALCQRIIETHKGKIMEIGQELQGAHFVITLKNCPPNPANDKRR